jgi:hypothetical protein
MGERRAQLSRGVDRLAGVVERGVHLVGGAIGDLPETAGSLAHDGLGRLGAAPRWLGRVVAGVLSVVGAVVTGVTGIVGGVAAGVIRLVGGLLVWDRRLIARGAIDVGSSVGGAVVLLLGTVVAAGQRLVGAEAPARALSPDERALLRKVFGPSLGYRNVRLVQGRSGAFGTNQRPFTLGNTVYLKGVDLAERPDVLVHEVVHVWQYQHEGPRYTTDALGAQVIYGWQGRGAYDWVAELARGRTAWPQFNAEAQGAFVQDVWAAKEPTADHPELAAAALAVLQGRRTLRLSSRIRP